MESTVILTVMSLLISILYHNCIKLNYPVKAGKGHGIF